MLAIRKTCSENRLIIGTIVEESSAPISSGTDNLNDIQIRVNAPFTNEPIRMVHPRTRSIVIGSFLRVDHYL